jgi:Undecaprenyl-phosphate galactose phosphotransferase WbaP
METQGKSIDTALVVLNGMRSSAMEVSRVLEPYFRQVNLILPEGVLPLGLVEVHQIGSLPTLRFRNALADHKALIAKRFMDAILGSILTLAALPILIVISLAIKLDSPGPIIFVQKRIGKGGGEFPMFKFRTMYRDAESRLETILAKDPDGKLEWDSYQKLKNDPRVTHVGRFLRKLSLDELPQLWNVLRGEMSVVGPRPFFEDQREEYGEAYERYIRVPPGITGAWQVNGRNHTSFKERAAMDEYYVRNWSIWLDLYILALTPIAVFSRKGAY